MTDSTPDPRFELTKVVADGELVGISCILIVQGRVVAGVDVGPPTTTRGPWMFEGQTRAFVAGKKYGRMTYLPVLRFLADLRAGVFTDDGKGATPAAKAIQPWLKMQGVCFTTATAGSGSVMTYDGVAQFPVVAAPDVGDWHETACFAARKAHDSKEKKVPSPGSLLLAALRVGHDELPKAVTIDQLRSALETLQSETPLTFRAKAAASEQVLPAAEIDDALWDLTDADQVSVETSNVDVVICVR